MGKTKKTILFIILFSNLSIVLSQKTNIDEKYFYDDLTRLTIGFHYTNYANANYYFEDNSQKTVMDISPSKNFFIDYRIINIKNSCLKIGLFKNSFNYTYKYNGLVYNPLFGEIVPFDNQPYREYKISQYEFYLDYEYSIKLNNRWVINFSAGLSYEINDSLNDFGYQQYYVNENLEPIQTVYEGYFRINDTAKRYHFHPKVSYRIDDGLFCFGLKFSNNFEVFSEGASNIYPDPNSNAVLVNNFELSGEYISATLSFTPSKNLFKKKK